MFADGPLGDGSMLRIVEKGASPATFSAQVRSRVYPGKTVHISQQRFLGLSADAGVRCKRREEDNVYLLEKADEARVSMLHCVVSHWNALASQH